MWDRAEAKVRLQPRLPLTPPGAQKLERPFSVICFAAEQTASYTEHSLDAGYPRREAWLWVRQLSPAQSNFQRRPEAFPATKKRSQSLLKGDLGSTLQYPLIFYIHS